MMHAVVLIVVCQNVSISMHGLDKEKAKPRSFTDKSQVLEL
jgi:hypothetical protein